MVSCSITREFEEDQYLVRKNTVYIDGNKKGSGKEYNYIKQRPNKRVFGVPFYPNLYIWGDPEREKGFKKWLTKIGEKPVVLDTSQAYKSAQQLYLYYFNRGYFEAKTYYTVKYKEKKQFAYIEYHIEPGEPYLIRNIEYTMQSPYLEWHLQRELKNMSFQSGDIYNAEVLDNERSRLTQIFRNKGFYGFNKEYIYFEVDSFIDGRYVDVTMGIENKLVQQGDTNVYKPHVPYTIGDIYVIQDFDRKRGARNYTDTTVYNGYTFLHNGEMEYRPRLFSDAIELDTGQWYLEKDVDQTYNHFITYRVFRTTDIRFYPKATNTDSISRDSIPIEKQNQLDAFVFLKPFDKMSTGFEVEGTNASGNLGVSGSFFFKNQNLFGGGEILDMRIRGSVEAQAASGSNNIFNTREIGLEGSINFPYLLLPFNTEGFMPKRYIPTSRIAAGFRQQGRIDFTRSLFRFGLSYAFNENRFETHQLDLLDLSYVRLSDIRDSTFLNSQRIRTGFENTFIPALGYTYTFNNQLLAKIKTNTFFRGKLEFAGNLSTGLARAFNAPVNTDGQVTLFNNPFAQYFKYELDFRKYFQTLQTRKTAFRLYVGSAFPYGNSENIPFEKQFFGGGSNDNRAWVAYSMDPGSSDNPETTVSTGDIKIMANLEYRFNIIGGMDGAFFVDAGNIWLINPDEDFIGGDFQFNRFWREFAVGTGLGIRYDFDFFIIRLDAGFKVHRPSLPEGERWTADELRPGNAILNFGLGYPF
jgi:hypothetical protein